MSLLEQRIIQYARREAENDLDYKIDNFRQNMLFLVGYDAVEKHEQIESHLKAIKELIIPGYLEIAERRGIETFYNKVRKLPD